MDDFWKVNVLCVKEMCVSLLNFVLIECACVCDLSEGRDLTQSEDEKYDATGSSVLDDELRAEVIVC